MTDPAATSTHAYIEEERAKQRVLPLPVLCLLAMAIGVVAAVGALVFRLLISLVHNLAFLGRFSFSYQAEQFNPLNPWGIGVIFVPVIGGLIVVWLVRTFAPEARGGGVPQVMEAIYHNKADIRGVVGLVKPIAASISIGSGASVGREGPIIQIGAAFGSSISRHLLLPGWQKVTLLSAGAGAGIAATFNTPLGGVIFATELLLPEVSNRTFLPVVVATATATFIGRMLFGLDPAFLVPGTLIADEVALTIGDLLSFAALGVVAGLASWAFIRALERAEDAIGKLSANPYLQCIAAMLGVGLIGYGFLLTTGNLQTIGVGYATIQSILSGGASGIWLLLALAAGKLAATALSLAGGASGGVFTPSLFIGAAVGGAVGVVATMVPGVNISVIEFAVVGMGALVGGAAGASMTAIVMIFEMTRDYGVIVPLVLAVAVAVGVRRALIADNIYTIMLRHRGRAIPTNRHTNMYLVRQAQELMSTAFVVLPATTAIPEALDAVRAAKAQHVVVTDNARIVGFARLASMHEGDKTLREVMADDYVIATRANILNTVIARMNRRKRSLALVVDEDTVVPRPDDVAGVIDAPELAGAVIANHYA